jgi:DNA-binding MarR family transcriptional regulator
MVLGQFAARPVMTIRKPSADYRPPEHALWLLKRAFHNGHRAVNEAVRDFGVTPTQLGTLNRLVAEPGLSGADLARRLLVTPQAAQLALAALERRGLIERRPDPNHGRIVRTYLTKEGRRIAGLSMERGLRAEDEFLSVFDESERKTLLDYLTRLARQEPPDNAGLDAAEI